jgi:hypothetical protein
VGENRGEGEFCGTDALILALSQRERVLKQS